MVALVGPNPSTLRCREPLGLLAPIQAATELASPLPPAGSRRCHVNATVVLAVPAACHKQRSRDSLRRSRPARGPLPRPGPRRPAVPGSRRPRGRPSPGWCGGTAHQCGSRPPAPRGGSAHGPSARRSPERGCRRLPARSRSAHVGSDGLCRRSILKGVAGHGGSCRSALVTRCRDHHHGTDGVQHRGMAHRPKQQLGKAPMSP
jgi:hypothetical protein